MATIVDDKIDSAATSGRSEDEGDTTQQRKPVTPVEDQCRPNQLYLGTESTKQLSATKCAPDYRLGMNATVGGQIRDIRRYKMHAVDRIGMRDTCFAKYRTYNGENQCREMGRRERGCLVPFWRYTNTRIPAT